MSKHLQKYGAFDLEDAEEIENEMEKTFSAEWMKIKAGKNRVRFLPAPVGQKSLKMVWEHQINLPDGGFVNFACPRLMAKKSCIVCRKTDQLKATGNPADLDRAKELFPRKRIYANVIDRQDPDVGPKILAFGVKIWEQLKEIREDEDYGGDFTNPETGFDVIIKRKGMRKNDTEYLCKATRASPLGDEDWLKQQHSLVRFAQILTEEQIREKLSSDSKRPSKDDDADEDEQHIPPAKDTVVDASFEEIDDDDISF